MKRICLILLTCTIFAAGGNAMALELKSSTFNNNEELPSRYTCDDLGISPPLSWSGAPTNTKSFAIISDDPDAPVGTWVHWVFWNIPSTTTNLSEGVKPLAQLPDGSMQGINDSKNHGYDSPCPPSGTHRYFFKLYALDAMLSLDAKSTKRALESAMKGHVLAEAILMGNYSRKKR